MASTGETAGPFVFIRSFVRNLHFLLTNRPGQEESPKAIVVGIAVDVGYFQAAGNTEEAVLTDVSILVNDATKHIYAPQMNVYISIGPTDVRSTLGGPSWNRSPPCGLSAQSALGDFRTYVSLLLMTILC